MPSLGVKRPIPVPDELSKPFWAAANKRQLVVQNCKACNRLQHPPERVCAECRSAENLEWKPVSGRGTIFSFGVTSDTRYIAFYEIQPYNSVVISLAEDPDIKFYSNLPGRKSGDVPTGATVEVEWEDVEGQLIPEWRVVE